MEGKSSIQWDFETIMIVFNSSFNNYGAHIWILQFSPIDIWAIFSFSFSHLWLKTCNASQLSFSKSTSWKSNIFDKTLNFSKKLLLHSLINDIKKSQKLYAEIKGERQLEKQIHLLWTFNVPRRSSAVVPNRFLLRHKL